MVGMGRFLLQKAAGFAGFGAPIFWLGPKDTDTTLFLSVCLMHASQVPGQGSGCGWGAHGLWLECPMHALLP